MNHLLTLWMKPVYRFIFANYQICTQCEQFPLCTKSVSPQSVYNRSKPESRILYFYLIKITSLPKTTTTKKNN